MFCGTQGSDATLIIYFTLTIRYRMLSKSKLTRNDWLDAALLALEDEGIDGVKIERLARNLGVTKGSFYWHFKDRRMLLDELLIRWDEKCTTPVIEAIARLDCAPLERLDQVERLLEDLALERLERAIFVWAQWDPAARAHLNQAIFRRLEFVRENFHQAGFEGEEAEVRAMLFVYRQLGRLYFSLHECESDRDTHARIRLRLLTAPLLPPEPDMHR